LEERNLVLQQTLHLTWRYHCCRVSDRNRSRESLWRKWAGIETCRTVVKNESAKQDLGFHLRKTIFSLLGLNFIKLSFVIHDGAW